MKEVLIFHHSDLDGMGVKILGVKFAMSKNLPYKTFKCNYSDVNDIVYSEVSKRGIDGIEEVIIGDISVNPGIGSYLDELYEDGLKIRLRDHHETASHLNKYPWAYVHETDSDGVGRCGTYILAHDIDMLPVALSLGNFITNVDDWDTWKWTINGNEDATKLNDLFQAMGEDYFTEYILDNVDKDKVFTSEAEVAIKIQQGKVERTASRCIKNMYITHLYVKKNRRAYRTGIIFCMSDISSVCNKVLEECPDIDILLAVNLPSGISLRTRKDISISLGDLAKELTGSGGGHPKSAGGNISKTQMINLIKDSVELLSHNNVKARKIHQI